MIWTAAPGVRLYVLNLVNQDISGSFRGSDSILEVNGIVHCAMRSTTYLLELNYFGLKKSDCRLADWLHRLKQRQDDEIHRARNVIVLYDP